MSVKAYDTDRYARSVAVVFADGTNVNQEILKAGYARQYRKYCKASFCTDWLRLEEDARRAERGLWEWRKDKQSGGRRHLSRECKESCVTWVGLPAL